MTDTPLDLAAQIVVNTRCGKGTFLPGESCVWTSPCDVCRLVAALRKAEAARDEQARFKEAQRADKRKARALLSEWRMRTLRLDAQVAAVLALPEREWSEDHADSPESRAARAYNSALLAARRAITGGTDEG